MLCLAWSFSAGEITASLESESFSQLLGENGPVQQVIDWSPQSVPLLLVLDFLAGVVTVIVVRLRIVTHENYRTEDKEVILPDTLGVVSIILLERPRVKWVKEVPDGLLLPVIQLQWRSNGVGEMPLMKPSHLSPGRLVLHLVRAAIEEFRRLVLFQNPFSTLIIVLPKPILEIIVHNVEVPVG